MGDGRLQVRLAKMKPKDKIVAWITHLALTAAHGDVRTRLVAKDGECTFAEVEKRVALLLLDTLVEGYRAALNEPMPFFTDASHAYAKQKIAFEAVASGSKSSRVSKEPIACAQDAFDGTDFGERATGDRTDTYVALCWRGRDPLDPDSDDFERWSLAFWRPAMEALARAEAVS